MFMRTAYHRWWDQDEADERLLIGYATGALDDALAMLAEAYTELNDHARHTLQGMQTMCGALLEEIAPMPVSEDCRRKLMAGLDDDPCDTEECRQQRTASTMPLSLQRRTGNCHLEELNWHHKRRGVDVARVQGLPASVLRVSPGLTPVKPIYNTVRFTLVLDGALVRDGETLQRGSLHVTTPDSRAPVATCPENGVVVLSTQENFCLTAKLLCFLMKV